MSDRADDTPAVERVDRLSWAEVRRLALHHKKSLWIANGVAVLNANGSVTYTPAQNFSGTDTFTYTVTDGLLSAVGTVTVTVGTGGNPPVANGQSVSTNEDTALVIADGTWRNELSHEELAGGLVRAGELLKNLPVALLSRQA